MAVISMETKREKKIILFLSPYFFILIIIKLMHNEMSGLKNKQNSFSTSTYILPHTETVYDFVVLRD